MRGAVAESSQFIDEALAHRFSTSKLQHTSREGHARLRTLKMGLQAE